MQRQRNRGSSPGDRFWKEVQARLITFHCLQKVSVFTLPTVINSVNRLQTGPDVWGVPIRQGSPCHPGPTGPSSSRSRYALGCAQRAPGEGTTTGDGDRLAHRHRPAAGNRAQARSGGHRAQARCPRLRDSILQSTISCSKRSWSTDKTTARDTLGFTAAGDSA